MARLARPNLSLAQGVVPFVGLPIDDIKQTHDELVLRSQAVHEQAGALSEYISSVNDLGVDGIKKMKSHELDLNNTLIQGMTNNKDAHFRVREMSNTARRIRSHAGINKARELATQHAALVEHNTNVEGWSQVYKDAASQYSLESVKGFEYDSKSNSVKNANYNAFRLDNAPDFNKDIAELMKHFKPDTVSNVGFSEFKGNISNAITSFEKTTGADISPYLLKYKQTVEQVTYYDVQRAVTDYIESTPAAQTYFRSKAFLDTRITNKGLEALSEKTGQDIDILKLEAIKDKSEQYLQNYVTPPRAVAAYYSKNLKPGENIADKFEAFNGLTTTQQQSIIKDGSAILKDDYMSKLLDESVDLDAVHTNLNYQMEVATVAQLHGNVFAYTSNKIDKDLIENAYRKLKDEYSKGVILQTPGGQISVEDELVRTRKNRDELNRLNQVVATRNFEDTDEYKYLNDRLEEAIKTEDHNMIKELERSIDDAQIRFNDNQSKNVALRNYYEDLVEQDRLRIGSWVAQNIPNPIPEKTLNKIRENASNADGTNIDDLELRAVLRDIALRDDIDFTKPDIIEQTLLEYGVKLKGAFQQNYATNRLSYKIESDIRRAIADMQRAFKKGFKDGKMDSPYALLHIDKSRTYDELETAVKHQLLNNPNGQIVYGKYVGNTTAHKDFKKAIEGSEVEFTPAYNHYKNDSSFTVYATYTDPKSKKVTWKGYINLFDSSFLNDVSANALINEVNSSEMPLTSQFAPAITNMLTSTFMSRQGEFIGVAGGEVLRNTERTLGHLIQGIKTNNISRHNFKITADSDIEIRTRGDGYVEAWLKRAGQNPVSIADANEKTKFTKPEELYPLLYLILNSNK